MRVHFLNKLDEDLQNKFESSLEIKVNISSGEIQSKHNNVKILIAGRPTRKQLDKLPDLEILIIPWTGVPEETRSVLAYYSELEVHNLHHNANSTAELALGLLLSVAKQILPMDRSLRQGNWQPRYQNQETILLTGKNALILGYGEIGKRIKNGLDGLGVNTKVIKRNVPSSNLNDFIYPPEMIHQLLPDTEILILALPLIEETEDLIGEKELSLLPSSAILINISRGKIVNQDALYRALKEHRIFGAGLDVWYNYPDTKEARENTLPGDFPFHELDNLVFSPHRGGIVVETEELRMADLARLINAAGRGDKIPNRVDINLGY